MAVHFLKAFRFLQHKSKYRTTLTKVKLFIFYSVLVLENISEFVENKRTPLFAHIWKIRYLTLSDQYGEQIASENTAKQRVIIQSDCHLTSYRIHSNGQITICLDFIALALWQLPKLFPLCEAWMLCSHLFHVIYPRWVIFIIPRWNTRSLEKNHFFSL